MSLVPALPMEKGTPPPPETIGILAQLDVPSAYLMGLGIKG